MHVCMPWQAKASTIRFHELFAILGNSPCRNSLRAGMECMEAFRGLLQIKRRNFSDMGILGLAWQSGFTDERKGLRGYRSPCRMPRDEAHCLARGRRIHRAIGREAEKKKRRAGAS